MSWPVSPAPRRPHSSPQAINLTPLIAKEIKKEMCQQLTTTPQSNGRDVHATYVLMAVLFFATLRIFS